MHKPLYVKALALAVLLLGAVAVIEFSADLAQAWAVKTHNATERNLAHPPGSGGPHAQGKLT